MYFLYVLLEGEASVEGDTKTEFLNSNKPKENETLQAACIHFLEMESRDHECTERQPVVLVSQNLVLFRDSSCLCPSPQLYMKTHIIMGRLQHCVSGWPCFD